MGDCRSVALLLAPLLVAGGLLCAAPPCSAADAVLPPGLDLVPWPESVEPGTGTFVLEPGADIYVSPATDEPRDIGRFLAERLVAATGQPHQVLTPNGPVPSGSLTLALTDRHVSLGEEGYALTVTPERVQLEAASPQGLFHGVQTLRQLLPADIERATPQPGPWTIGAVAITDRPRFAWRGAMLDVARHFFDVASVERFVDLLAYYKLNRLHLHLSDDQGWRIAVDAWPRLAEVGGRSEVGGGAGGAYSQAEYAEIVAYARRRHVVVVPEIDVPGHTNAALAAYPDLNCDGVARAPFTGVAVGFSSLCLAGPRRDIALSFVRDVVREIARLTPGPWFHVGGDEAASTDPTEYRRFMAEVQQIVRAEGKTPIGWEEIANAELAPGTIVQQWDRGLIGKAVGQGAKVILSPSSRVYLDMKYSASTRAGRTWAGLVEVRDSYDWEPATYLAGVSEADILGVEGAIWTERIRTPAELEYMAMPRLAGIAEIGWSPRGARSWSGYRLRLAGHGPRLEAMGVGFHRSPQVPWR